MITPADLSAITGVCAYIGSVATHLFINKKGNNTVNLTDIENDVKNLLSKVQSADSDVITTVSNAEANPAVNSLTNTALDAVEKGVPESVINAVEDVIKAARDFSGTATAPATKTVAPVAPASATTPVPATAPVPDSEPAKAETDTVPGQASAAHLMGLPQ